MRWRGVGSLTTTKHFLYIFSSAHWPPFVAVVVDCAKQISFLSFFAIISRLRNVYISTNMLVNSLHAMKPYSTNMIAEGWHEPSL